MNATPFLHLAWKEYLAVRAFWLAVVVLTLLLQALILATMREGDERSVMLLNFALGAPAFFAAGIAGTAFSVEREEGTFEFLRASPVTPRQTLLSKLAIGVLATAAMYLILAPIAHWFTQGRLPFQFQLSQLWGLWGVAAIEGLAWGTLFSLVCDRPLLAVCLALFTTSSVTHLLSWTTLETGAYKFGLAPYTAAIPQRLLVVALVVAADVYLGLRWLRGPAETPPLSKQGAKAAAVPHFQSPMTEQMTFSPAGATFVHPELAALRAKRSRAAMLGHLLWQQWRQSRWLMVIMGTIFIAAALIALYSGASQSHNPTIPLAIMSTLIGACVFLADQERRQYRYFVEHNVPARYVWLSRLAPWAFTLLIATVVVYFFWGELLWSVLLPPEALWESELRFHYNYGSLPPWTLGLAWIAVSFAAGQWASMFLRSGVLAGFVGLILSGVLCAWVALMQTLAVPWWWSVAPIPLVLLGATWLRAPDWAREITSWRARLRALAVLVAPAVALVVTLAWHRVNEIPDISHSGLSTAAANLASIPPSALAAAEKYREAERLFTPLGESTGSPGGPSLWEKLQPSADHTLTPGLKAWLNENAESLKLMLEASAEPACLLVDPRTSNSVNGWRQAWDMQELVRLSAWQLENEGQLDAALDRYFAALKISEHWIAFAPVHQGIPSFAPQIFTELRYWGVQKGQTAERVTAALERLKGVSPNILRLGDRLEGNLILENRHIEGDANAHYLLGIALKPAEEEQRRLWERFMPWERERERRLVRWIHEIAVHRWSLAERNVMPNGFAAWATVPGQESASGRHFGERIIVSFDPQELFQFAPHDNSISTGAGREASWLATTWIDDAHSGMAGIVAARELLNFEAQRRGTMLVLAVEAYRLKNGAVPKSLGDLLGTYFDELPIDPYSGVPFRYLPGGLPTPKTPEETKQRTVAENYYGRLPASGTPAIWCSGTNLQFSVSSDGDDWESAPGEKPAPEDTTVEADAEILFARHSRIRYVARPGTRAPESLRPLVAIVWGSWFEIPNENK